MSGTVTLLQILAFRFAGQTTVGVEALRIQQLWAHPTKRPRRDDKGFGQNTGAQVIHGHQTEIRNTGDGRVIDEVDKNVCLLYLSAREK